MHFQSSGVGILSQEEFENLLSSEAGRPGQQLTLGSLVHQLPGFSWATGGAHGKQSLSISQRL